MRVRRFVGFKATPATARVIQIPQRNVIIVLSRREGEGWARREDAGARRRDAPAGQFSPRASRGAGRVNLRSLAPSLEVARRERRSARTTSRARLVHDDVSRSALDRRSRDDPYARPREWPRRERTLERNSPRAVIRRRPRWRHRCYRSRREIGHRCLRRAAR